MATDDAGDRTVARALLDAAINTETFNDDAISSSEVLTFMERITVQEDPALTAMLPKHMANRVTVGLTTGQALTEEVQDLPPVTDAQLEAKFHGLLRPLVSDAERASILSQLWDVDQLPDLAPLFVSMTLDGEPH